jgi:tetratricopeptide (TPR) repeat protein
MDSDDEIDISTPPRAQAMKGVFQWILWLIVFITFFVLTAVFDFDITWALLAVVGVAVLAFLGWIAWFVVVKRGALTWMRLAQKPARLFARGDAEAAERAFSQALARARRFAPNDHRRGVMLCELAMYAKNQGRYDEAIDLYEESVDILGRDLARQPMDYFVALNNYAICFIHLKDHDSAQQILEKVVDLTLATRTRGTAFKIQLQQIPAIEFVLHLNLAFLFIEMNELAEAKLHLEDADALWPELPGRARTNYGDHHIAIWTLWLYSSGRFAEAESELAEAANPDYPACLRLFARLCLVRQDFKAAEAALRKHQQGEKKKGTLHRPEFVEHILDLAECQFGLGDFDAALAAVAEARSLVDEFKLPKGAAWLRTLQTWIVRATERGQGELVEALQKEIDAIPPRTPEQAIKVLEKFRVHRRNL